MSRPPAGHPAPERLGSGTRALARTVELCATFVTGLGVLGLVQPRAHVALWQDAPLGLGARVAPSVGNPARRRREAAGQLAGGLATLVLLHALLARRHGRR